MIKCRLFIVIAFFSLVTFYRIEAAKQQSISVKSNKKKLKATPQPTRFAQMRKLYPKVPTGDEARHWRKANGDNIDEHPCKRECVENQKMTCYYYMVIHSDETMGPACARYMNAKNRFKCGKQEYINSYNIHNQNGRKSFDDCKYADGVKTEIMVINGQLPASTIEVCYGDTIVADVFNSLLEPTTVHWHGIHQYASPNMDGSPYITQYPIVPGQALRYRFEVDNAGTLWYHSHVEHQRGFGLAGPLIVRVPHQNNPHAKLYDIDCKENVIFLQDWVHDMNAFVAKNILVNGLGRNVSPEHNKPTLYANFTVTPGKRYRFRVILNGISFCPLSLSIDQHDLLVISSDGNDIEPIVVEKIFINAAERIDFVLHANRKVANYWIRIKGHGFCANSELHQEAILHYEGAERLQMPSGPALSYNYEPPNAVEFNGFNISSDPNCKHFGFKDANATALIDTPTNKPEITLYTSLNMGMLDGSFLAQMDHITFVLPKFSMLQARNLGIDKQFCNRTQQLQLGKNCLEENCKCTHVLQVPAFKHIEIVVTSTLNITHPIHLHGYTFRVVGMGVLGSKNIDQIEEIDRKNPLPRRLSKAPLKDTVQVPGYGYTIIRFYTNNPGYWMFHCHISTHSESGMSSILRVGEDHQMKMAKTNCELCCTGS